MVNRSMQRLGIDSVNISKFRRSPARYFINTPVEVLSNGRPIGYLLDTELFEEMIKVLTQYQDPVVLKKELGLTDDWLREVRHESR